MIRKSTMIALAAAASFGFALASPTVASAKGGMHANVGKVSNVKVSIRVPNRPGNHVRPHLPRHPHWHVHYRHPRIWYAPRPVLYGAVTPTVTTSRCTCLTKEYTPDGAVLFKDICTNEAAINPPAMQPTAEVQQPK